MTYCSCILKKKVLEFRNHKYVLSNRDFSQLFSFSSGIIISNRFILHDALMYHMYVTIKGAIDATRKLIFAEQMLQYRMNALCIHDINILLRCLYFIMGL